MNVSVILVINCVEIRERWKEDLLICVLGNTAVSPKHSDCSEMSHITLVKIKFLIE